MNPRVVMPPQPAATSASFAPHLRIAHTEDLVVSLSAQQVAARMADARAAQHQWASTPIARRLAVIRRARQLLADRAGQIAGAIILPQRRSSAETLAAEVLPLIDACRFLERRAAKVLAPARPAGVRPLWLAGNRSRLTRLPLGLVLIIGPSNYPLMLPGVQAVQALAAGNAVVLKPGRDGSASSQTLAALLTEAGLDPRLLVVLPEAPIHARHAIAAGVDHVVLTGSAQTGAAVLRELAPRLVPAVMELSGCDAMLVLEDADLSLAARALRFGLTFNAGATCIAPRRVLVQQTVAAAFEQCVGELMRTEEPVRVEASTLSRARELIGEALSGGARLIAGQPPAAESTRMFPVVLADVPRDAALLRTDVFAPVAAMLAVRDGDEAIRMANDCPYALGASVFGSATRAAAAARKLRAGSIVVNDLIAPTADPRLPFGGAGHSGFGVTRGAEGLLAMTRPQAVTVRHGNQRPHYQTQPEDARLLTLYARAAHGSGGRWAALWQLLRTLRRGRTA